MCVFNFSSFPYQQKTCKFILEIFFNLQNRKLIYLNTCSEAKIYRNPKGGHFIVEEAWPKIIYSRKHLSKS